tara:strand:- start:791 stop:1258 length:468 start_codon:yes stop_codon:yes gene_type:complete
MATSETIDVLSRQAARWSTASVQDQSPFIQNLHANYGVAYALAVRDIATDDQIEQVIGTSGRDLLSHTVQAQDQAAERLAKHAPQLMPRGPLVGIAREGIPTSYGQDQTFGQKIKAGVVTGFGIGIGHVIFALFIGGAGFLGFHLGKRRGRNEAA